MSRSHSFCLRLLAIGAVTLALPAATLRAQVPDRNGPPALGPPPRLSLPPIQEDSLSNGLRLVLMEKHDVPLVQLNVIVFSGADREEPGKYGLAAMTADMMDEGAAGKTALELADEIDFLGARIRTSAGDHDLGVSLYTPLAKLDDALPLMADVLLRPDFPPEELDRKRRSALTSLLQFHDQPTAIAAVAFSQGLYGKDHPYGRPLMTDEASIRSFSVTDLQTFHDTWVRPDNAAVVVVGAVTMAEIKPKLEALFRGWLPGARSLPPLTEPPTEQVHTRRVVLVDKPGAAQSVILMGRIGAARSTPDYYSIVVMNTVLGGSFTSRLNQDLREEKGYTYGASSSFAFNKWPGPFVAQSSVQTAVTSPALEEFFKQLRDIREPIPPEELDRAKNYEALGYPAAFQTVGGIAGQLTDMVLFDLPGDYFNRYVDRILAVGQDEALEAARKYVLPDAVLVVVVGDRSRIEAGVRALNLGPLEIKTPEDVLGPKPEVGRR